MKRMSVILLAALLAFMGCAQPAPQPEPVQLHLWHYYNGPQQTLFEALVTEFNETVGLQQGISINAQSKSGVNDLHDAVMAAARREVGAQPMPDLFFSYGDMAYPFFAQQLLANLDDYLTAEQRDLYFADYLQEGALDGGKGLYLFPTSKSTEVLMLNRTDFDPFAAACGVDYDRLSTWEGLVETAQLYYDYTDAQTPAPQDGKALFGRDSMANYMLVGAQQLGEPIFEVRDGALYPHLDEAVLRRLWDCYYVPYVQGLFLSLGRFRADDATTGDILAMVGSTSGANYFPNEVIAPDGTTHPIEALVLPAPNFAGTPPMACQQGAGIAVCKSTPAQEEAALTFLLWLTEPAQNIAFSAGTGYLPVRRDSLQQLLQPEALDSVFSPMAKNVITCAAQMTQSYAMSCSPVFDNAYDARLLLDESMQRRAETDRAAVLAQLELGTALQDACAPYLTDAHFAQWLDELTAQFDAL